MSLTANRRDILKFLGGSIAGVILTPVPWKLLDDTAIWTQTGPWITKVPRGKETFHSSLCTLCTASCPMNVQRVRGIPFAMHPREGQALCPTGLASHHLRSHPLRLRAPVRFSGSVSSREATPMDLEMVVNAAREMLMKPDRGSVVILDHRPGRTASLFYRTLVKNIRGGLYTVSPTDETRMFDGIRALSSVPPGSLGIDIEHARLIVSFGAPVFDHGIFGRSAGLKRGRTQKVIQVEPGYSRTSAVADEWIPLLPGTEGVLAMGLASLLIGQTGVKKAPAIFIQQYREQFTPGVISEKTGIPEKRIRDLADQLSTARPALVLGGSHVSFGHRPLADEMAIWGLNVLLGGIGTEGGILGRRDVPVPQRYRRSGLADVTNLEDIPDASVSLLLIDASQPGAPIPWKALERKLHQGGHAVLALTPTIAGQVRYADYAIPTAAPFEGLTDTVTPEGSLTPLFGMTCPTVPSPMPVYDPVSVIGGVFGTSATTQDLLVERIAHIHASGRGTVYVPSSGAERAVNTILAADDLTTMLLDGGIWRDQAPAGRLTCSFDRGLTEAPRAMSQPDPGELMLVLEGWRTSAVHAQRAPIMTKLVQESELWGNEELVEIHPTTASQIGLDDDAAAVLEVNNDARSVRVRLNAGVRPGIAQVALGPNPVTIGSSTIEFRRDLVDLINPDKDLGWIGARCRLRKDSHG